MAKRWEYNSQVFKDFDYVGSGYWKAHEAWEWLNQAGDEGWELVNSQYLDDDECLIFTLKREKI